MVRKVLGGGHRKLCLSRNEIFEMKALSSLIGYESIQLISLKRTPTVRYGPFVF